MILLRSGASIMFAPKSLGHISIMTTQKYFVTFDLAAQAEYMKALTPSFDEVNRHKIIKEVNMFMHLRKENRLNIISYTGKTKKHISYFTFHGAPLFNTDFFSSSFLNPGFRPISGTRCFHLTFLYPQMPVYHAHPLACCPHQEIHL